DGAVSGMPAIRETGPGKNLQAITVSTRPEHRTVGRIRRSRRIRHSVPDATLTRLIRPTGPEHRTVGWIRRFTLHPATVVGTENNNSPRP
ncbi:hypothetical protein C9179_10170, partial [Escherichia coli]